VRLAQAKRHLADLRLNYTDKHPDVIEAEHNVATLKGEIAARPTGNGEGKTQISNPTYEQLKLKLIDAEAVVPTLKARLDKAGADYARAKLLSSELPGIQAKSQDIDRDYDVLKSNYDELVKRRESANLSQAADDRADRTQFRVVDPPQLPLRPAFPNRLFLLSMATLLGIAAGIAAPILLTRIHPTYATTARLREFGLPVIGAITYAPRPALETSASRMATRLYAAAATALVITFGGIALLAGGIHKSLW
jgi:polysaccharide chain length determinant protein (PEP-CTERM system associated)